MKNQHIHSCLLAIIIIFLVEHPVFAAIGAESMEELYSTILTESKGWKNEVAKYAFYILFFTASISFAIGFKDLIVGGGVTAEGIVSLLVRQFLIIGILKWILDNNDLLLLIPDSLTKLGVSMGGLEPTLKGASLAFDSIISPLAIYYSELNWLTAPGESLVSIVLIFFIYCLMVLFATTVLLVQLETIFILVGGMITASFFVLGYFRDVFMGYIKALFMNGLKLLLLALVLGLFMSIMSGWGVTLANSFNVPSGTTLNMTTVGAGMAGLKFDAKPSALYAVALPMVFGLLAFYILLKSVPQYAVAILTGHATADGGMAKAAVMAGVGTAATVWNISRGISQTANNTAKATNNAANAFGNQVAKAVDKDGNNRGTTKGAVMGALSAVKAFATYPLSGQIKSSGERSYGISSSNTNSSVGNEMKAGSALFDQTHNNAYEAAKLYFGEENKGG